MIHLDESSIKIVKAIFKAHLPGRKVLAFGSRVKGDMRSYSDLDLCITGNPLSLEKLIHLKEAFSESDLPIRVDIVEWDNISSVFQDIIKKQFEEIV